MGTIPPMDALILANQAELVQWDAYDKKLYSVLLVSTKDAANSFLVCFAGRSDSRQEPEGQVAWKAMSGKYLNSSMQLRRILMCKLNGMAMRLNQDPHGYLTKVFQQRDKPEHIDEGLREARFLHFILEGLSDNYEPIQFAAERNPEISLKEIVITMQNMYATRAARGEDSTFSREKGRESAMTPCSGFKGSCDYCNKPGHKKSQCFKFLHESGGGP